MTTPAPAGQAEVPVQAAPAVTPPGASRPAARRSTARRSTTRRQTTRRQRSPLLPRALVMLLGAGAAVLVLGGVRATAWLIGPAFLALMIVIALSPVQSWLRRKGWPAWLTTLVLVLLVLGVLVVFALVVVVSLARLAGLLGQYTDRADDLQNALASSLTKFGVEPGQLQD